MADFGTEGPSGELDDSVTVTLGGETAVRCENYSVHSAIVQQPAAFALQLGAGRTVVADLIAKYPPGTPFALDVGGKRQFVGRIDGYDASGPSGSTSLKLKGRDLLAALFDNDVQEETSYTNMTYFDLVTEAMKQCNVGDFPLFISNDDNRMIKSGIGVTTAKAPAPKPAAPTTAKPSPLSSDNAKLEALYRDFTAPSKPTAFAADVKPLVFNTTNTDIAKERIASGAGTGGGGAVKYVVHAKLGESWLDLVMRHLKKAGLFMWTAQDGSFVLATPAKRQKPTCLFVRQRNQLSNVCNVVDAQFTNDTTKRFSEVVLYARGLGRKHGRGKVRDGFVDTEMIGLGLNKRKVYRDVNVTSARQAEFYARCRIAEANRNAWRLVYTFSGHTAPTMTAGQKAIPVPDSVARVEDDELGIHQDLYIESVSFQSPPRTTTVTMMRLQDLVFEDDQERPDPNNGGLKGSIVAGTNTAPTNVRVGTGEVTTNRNATAFTNTTSKPIASSNPKLDK